MTLQGNGRDAKLRPYVIAAVVVAAVAAISLVVVRMQGSEPNGGLVATENSSLVDPSSTVAGQSATIEPGSAPVGADITVTGSLAPEIADIVDPTRVPIWLHRHDDISGNDIYALLGYAELDDDHAFRLDTNVPEEGGHRQSDGTTFPLEPNEYLLVVGHVANIIEGANFIMLDQSQAR